MTSKPKASSSGVMGLLRTTPYGMAANQTTVGEKIVWLPLTKVAMTRTGRSGMTAHAELRNPTSAAYLSKSLPNVPIGQIGGPIYCITHTNHAWIISLQCLIISR